MRFVIVEEISCDHLACCPGQHVGGRKEGLG